MKSTMPLVCTPTRQWRGLLLVVLFLSFFSLPLYGQSSNQGSIVGTVSDPSGAAIPGVELTITNTATDIQRTALTNERGRYRADFLIPGVYDVTVELPGFKKANLVGNILKVGQILRVDVQLQVGQITESVTVTDAADVLNTESPSLGETIDEVKIQNLPLNGREFIDLVGLVPGAEVGNTKRGAADSKGTTIGFNGARSVFNTFTVDGADSTEVYYNQLISSPPLDAIREFRVITNMYSAEYGRAGGGVVTVTTKSGTNKFHGSLYEYHRNKSLDAIPYFFIGTREEQPAYLYNQFGGSIGGPIVKNKTFFFFSAEFFRQKKPGNNIVSFAPTEKQKVGDLTETLDIFNGQPVQLINPFTGEAIPGNKMPPSMINPVGQALMDIWSEQKPNFDDPFLNLHFMRVGSNNRDKYIARIDHNFDEQNILSGSFNFGDYDNTSVHHTKFGDKNSLQHDRTLVLSYTRVFSPSLVNDLKGNFTWFDRGSDFVLKDKVYAQDWGIWSASEQVAGGSPRVLLYGRNSRRFDIGNSGAFRHNTRNLYLKDNLRWATGNHTLTFGADFKKQEVDFLDDQARADGFFYFGWNDSPNRSGGRYLVTGSTFSSVLMGVVGRQFYDPAGGQLLEQYRNMLALWVEDNWKVTPRLTLNLGLRYDYTPPFAERNGQMASLNYETGRLQFPPNAPSEKLALAQFDYDLNGKNWAFEPNKLDFSPRVGFAFRPFDDNRTVIRGGYGIFYTLENHRTSGFGSRIIPFRGQQIYYANAFWWPDRQSRFQTLDKPPIDWQQTLGKSPGSTWINAPYYPSGYLQHYNLTIERALARTLVAEIAYVGTKGTNLAGGSALSNFSPELSAKVKEHIPGWNPGVRLKGNNSKYNSLQLKLRKDTSYGLNFLSAFTWGRAMAESSNDDIFENLLLDNDETLELIPDRAYSRADFDVRRRFSFSGGYRLPWGRGMRWGADWTGFVDTLLGGWRTHFIVTLQDGYPHTVRTARNRRPDRVCDGNLPPSQRTVQRWFEADCFPDHPSRRVVNPETGRLVTVDLHGDAGVNLIDGPGIQNLNLGMHKILRVSDVTRVQFRFEMFNALNHPNFWRSPSFFRTNSGGVRINNARRMRDIQFALKILF